VTPEERKEFLGTHRLAIAGLERGNRAPHLSPVYYVMDGDDLLISTTQTRVKAKLARRAGLQVLKSFPESSYRFPIKYFSRNICLLVRKPQP